ncbi:MAG: polyprenyl synthetase family protein [Clostridia bacterium]|nr:polyprenyl synthetase family protein [Clostridia bacterium]
MINYEKNMAKAIVSENKALIEAELEKLYAVDASPASKLYEAQRYSLLSGGKRIRPSLVIESCRMLGGNVEAAIPFAEAVEMIHTYSLIHDDLPCMDDDDMRRGNPTCHKVYGEAMATLAGDGLLTDAFSVCVMNPHVTGDCAATAVALLSGAAGSFGMVRGQVTDLYGESNKLTEEQLVELHLGKTGAMICVSVQLGALAAGIAPNDERVEKLTAFAQRIGLAFQIIDDILDATASEEVLGKSVGSDKDKNKTTFLSFFTVEQARAQAEEMTVSAIKQIADIEGSERLIALALYLCDREN